MVEVPSAPKGGRWPHRVARARADGQSLGEAEAAARERLVKKLADELVRLKAPVALELGASMADYKGLQYLAAGKRVATLRRRLGDWRRLAAWTAAQCGQPGYPDLQGFLAYLEARAGEPCGRTVLRSAFEALGYMEEMGQVPTSARVSATRLAASAVQELTAGLEGSRGALRRQAQYLPVEVAAAWEHVVACPDEPAYVRIYP